MNMSTIVTFGEIMIRFDTPGYTRIRQAMPGQLNTSFAGAEANVAVSIANLGGQSRFVTALPDNRMTEACLGVLRSYSVETHCIVKSNEGRFGAYYVETGANQRPSNVTYDRSHSSVSLAPANRYDWKRVFENGSWFHTTGITPALSRIAADTTLFAVSRAKEMGMKVSLDLNFRKKLWDWHSGKTPNQLAEEELRKLLPYVDVLIANEEDAESVLGIRADDTDVHSGEISLAGYESVAKKIREQFPNISKVAITLRESLSATHNRWGALLFDSSTDRIFCAPTKNGDYVPYEIRMIVDRVGGGDSFAAALVYALATFGYSDNQKAIDFAVAASCLAHSIPGDFNLSTRSEVEALVNGSTSGRVVR